LTQPLDFFGGAAGGLGFVIPLHRLHSVSIHGVIRVKGWHFSRSFIDIALVNGRRRAASFDKLKINDSLVKRLRQ